MSRRLVATFFALALATLCFVVPANAQLPNLNTQDATLLLYWQMNTLPFTMDDTRLFNRSLQAKAQVDECYFGLGDANWNDPTVLNANWAKSFGSFIANYPKDFSPTQISDCLAAGGHPKVNQSYVWGLAEGKPGELWFGTVGNTLCLVLDGYYSGLLPPTQNQSWGCQMRTTTRPYGDIRPPRIYRYNTVTKELVDKTPLVPKPGGGTMPDPKLLETIGLRSAGALNGVVILAGVGTSGVTAFAFDTDTGDYLGSYRFDGQSGRMGPYSNIRQWITYNGELYTGVALPAAGPAGSSAGRVLRWTGNKTNPFQFEIVGNVHGDPAYLVVHQGQMYSSTWGGPSGSGGFVISQSPVINGRLTNANADGWQDVWKLSNYEVEPTALQAGGAIASFGGWIYWGTMHVPATGAVAFYSVYGKEPGLADFLGSYRPIMIFRGRNFGTPQQEVQLLYGNTTLPKYDAASGTWSIVPNKLGQKPKYGPAGFGNFFNNYTWWMQNYKNELFVGTMDWSYLASTLAGDSGFGSYLPSTIKQQADSNNGADIFHFMNSSAAAIPYSSFGASNKLNYGVRTMIVINNGRDLYLGSANPMNLETTPGTLNGGWELIKVTRIY